MRVNCRMSSVLLIVFALLSSTSIRAAAEAEPLMENYAAVLTTIDFVANIETIGVAVSGTSLPPTAELSYRQSGDIQWRSGHRLMRIDDGRLIGSLFNLLPATSYEIKVLVGSSEISGTVSTQPDQLSFTPTVILHVNDDGLPGGNGSATAPFRTIQEAVNHAGPGTQVLVADGVYREAVTFPVSGTPGNWIQVKAAGNAAILDSAERLSGNIWTQSSTSKVWFTNIKGPVAYLARAGNRFYQYDDKTGLMQAKGHAGITINEGWFYESGTQRLFVRSLDNPANYTWRVPRLNHAFDIATRDWLWIEGFEIRFYGTTTNGCGICTINASNIVIRRNRIHNMQLGIFINWTGTRDQGNNTRIEQNEVYDPLVNEWPWAAVKGSFMEGTGVIIRGHVGAIVRDNNVHNFFNGIYTGSSGALENPELAFDADIYGNYIHHVSDDGLEPEGACINQRFRNNTVDRSFIGISLAPITQGPTWVLRSAFTNFTGRGIKFADDSDGIVLIYQNTGWTNAVNVNGMDLITPIHNVVMRNNIFQSTGYSFAEVPIGSTGNDWNHNNWYTTRGSTGPHFKWEGVNYNTISALCTASGLECDGYENLPGFTNPTGGDFTLLSSSPNIDRGVVLHGINDDFVGNAPDAGAYEVDITPPETSIDSQPSNPSSSSSASFIFSGNDGGGSGIGSFECQLDGGSYSACTSPKTYSGLGKGSHTFEVRAIDHAGNVDPTPDSYTWVVDPSSAWVSSVVRSSASPTSATSVNFTVTFSADVINVDTGDFVLTTTGVSGASISGVSGSGAVYTVTVNSGTGNGTIRLDVSGLSDIEDLTGSMVGNLPYAGDQSYSIIKTGTFQDVPNTFWAWRFIEGLYNAGVTSGCSSSPMLYCPATTVTRDQMAVFLLRAKHGSSYSPPAATGVFQDVPMNYWAAPWIERLAAEGITGGCSASPKLYCPTTPVTRDQMAVFLLRAKYGSSYGPPLATGVFQDVPTNHWAAAWIERLAAEGITGGCSTSPMLYCPATPVSRDQMAVFLDRTFGIPPLP